MQLGTGMITTETPYKLREIIRDTWPQLYRPGKPEPIKNKKEEENDDIN